MLISYVGSLSLGTLNLPSRHLVRVVWSKGGVRALMLGAVRINDEIVGFVILTARVLRDKGEVIRR